MPVYLGNSLPGKGKTELAIKEICHDYNTNPNLKVVYVAPTKELQYQIKERLEKDLPIGHKIDIKIINIDTVEDGKSVKSEIVDFFKGILFKGPTVLIITANAVSNLYNQSFEHIDIVVSDEEIQPLKKVRFAPKDKSCKEIMYIVATQMIVVKDSALKEYYEITFKGSKNDPFEEFISSMSVLSDAIQSNKTVLCLKETFDAYKAKEIDYLTFTIVEHMMFLTDAKKTFFLGFDLKNSEMIKIYEKLYGFTYTDITNPADMSYSNDVNVYYLSEEDIGNGKLAENDDYKDIIVESYQNHLNQNTLVCDFNFKGYDPKEYNFDNILPAKSHGLNKDEWTTKTDVAIFAHFRHSPEEMKFLKDMGFTKAEADRAREGNIFVQVMARSAIRLKGNTLTTNIFLIDRRSADVVKELLGNTNVTLHKVEPVREFEGSGKKERKNKSNITPKEKSRMSYLRRKKREKGVLNSANQLELAALILKTGKTPKV